ncbi:ABC transporter substrate-binding protein [Amantichitinum ursilacus]|uniref:2'-hydroxybiphenyl-2-sulfinate desulfinase n=1 Tax=Amantichitinum ursilacus TaxID=857265 RepID=A0A0N0XHI9_9NEIS|nr:ABC transporter substrate-binding protein [Amantichitinum ursilacus]KPC49610.1 2'-hydroxybiphenyl-2-sulfinate desulfinase [Amantichitinum ursilacus]
MNQPALPTLWYTRCPVPTGLGIALQHGWLDQAFAAQCTEVRSLRESNDRAVRESHFDHTLQNSVRHGGNIPALWARSSGRETRVIGLSWADEVQLILTRPDSGIRTPADLKGRRFGLPRWRDVQIDFTRAQALRGLENALKLEGLSVADVELVDFDINAGYSDAPATRGPGGTTWNNRGHHNHELVGLLRGEVDAIFLKGAHGAQAARDFGLHVVIDTGSHPDPLIRSNNGTPRTLTVDQHLLTHHFDAAVRIVDQVLRAETWAWAHPDETRRYLAREANTSEALVVTAYGEDAHLRLRTNLAETSIAALQDFTDFLARWQFIPQRFDVRDWIDPRPWAAAQELQRANAETVAA